VEDLVAGCIVGLLVAFAAQWPFVRRLAASGPTPGWRRRGRSAARWLSCAIGADVVWFALSWLSYRFAYRFEPLSLCAFFAGLVAVAFFYARLAQTTGEVAAHLGLSVLREDSRRGVRLGILAWGLVTFGLLGLLAADELSPPAWFAVPLMVWALAVLLAIPYWLGETLYLLRDTSRALRQHAAAAEGAAPQE